MTMPRHLIYPLLLLLLSWNHQAAATSVLPISLERMTAAADVIFHGRVISNEVRRDPVSGNVATFTTFEVTEQAKGQTGETHTIKQIGGEIPGGNMRQIVHGVPRFSIGGEYVVFLPKASSLGFSSPIGLSQGKFEVLRINGEPVVSNRRAVAAAAPTRPGAAEIPSAVEATTPNRQGVRLEDFLQSVRAIDRE